MEQRENEEAVPVLDGFPIMCRDVAGLVVDATLMTPLGVNAKRAVAVVDNGDAARVRERYEHYRAASDVAQVVASYLRCHPAVEELRYPGLKSDPSFAVAARTLQGGFGPIVDYRVGGVWQRECCEPQDPREAVLALERKLLSAGSADVKREVT